ncbi:MAG TPA: ferredoxin [Nocardia sp.]|uniref:ferredoxin n=1 Tax=Nocardia sp. TaxID=1821 RepID=UPI002B4ABDF1|nr:ferredoxin [Nocardia sp.]HLS77448.1 ferredoxin [Nocardia sp.]
MELHLDKDKCVGHAQCFAASPRLFPLDDEGYSALTDTEIDPADRAEAEDGVEACPERALVLRD